MRGAASRRSRVANPGNAKVGRREKPEAHLDKVHTERKIPREIPRVLDLRHVIVHFLAFRRGERTRCSENGPNLGGRVMQQRQQSERAFGGASLTSLISTGLNGATFTRGAFSNAAAPNTARGGVCPDGTCDRVLLSFSRNLRRYFFYPAGL